MRIIGEPKAQLLWITPNAAYHVEKATRMCYKSEPSYDPAKTVEFLDRVINQMHHESVVEHACASFEILTDIAVGREITRHRIASYSQESTRYVNYSKEKHGSGIALLPWNDNLTAEQITRRLELWTRIQEVYLAEIAEGVKPQQARDNLPLCTKTELTMTANFREWRHFWKLRTSAAAHPQIRKVATQIGYQLSEACPELFNPLVYGPQS